MTGGGLVRVNAVERILGAQTDPRTSTSMSYMLRQVIDLLLREVDRGTGRRPVRPKRIRAFRDWHKSLDPDAIDLRLEYVDVYVSLKVVNQPLFLLLLCVRRSRSRRFVLFLVRILREVDSGRLVRHRRRRHAWRHRHTRRHARRHHHARRARRARRAHRARRVGPGKSCYGLLTIHVTIAVGLPSWLSRLD